MRGKSKQQQKPIQYGSFQSSHFFVKYKALF